MWALRIASHQSLVARPRLFVQLSTAASASGTLAGAANPVELKCVTCGQVGHRSKDCPNAGAAKKSAQDYFREGRCLVCGEVGHVAKACPTLGGHPEDFKPLQPQQKQTLEERNAEKLCYQCGSKGHIMRDCPVEPYARRIKRISKRYSGARLQKMLPELLKEERKLKPAHESLSHTLPKMGVVVSTSAQKTIGVLLPRTVMHPMLRIPLDRSTKVFVHDEEQQAVCGDVVLIQQTRPISKTKHHALKEIVLSLNDRRANVAEKIAGARALYAGISEEAIDELQKKRDNYEKRVALLRNKEQTTLTEEKAKINSELQQRIKDLNVLLQDADTENETRNEEWLKEMADKIEAGDKYSQELISQGKKLGEEILAEKDATKGMLDKKPSKPE